MLNVAEYAHDRKLCDACIAGWPLDPQSEVQRRRHWLRMEHRWDGATRPVVWFWVLLVLAISVGLLVLTITTDLHWPQVVMQTAIYVFFALTGYSRHVHKRLEPWCPWCHRDDGDEHFHPEPVAPPSVRADR